MPSPTEYKSNLMITPEIIGDRVANFWHYPHTLDSSPALGILMKYFTVLLPPQSGAVTMSITTSQQGRRTGPGTQYLSAHKLVMMRDFTRLQHPHSQVVCPPPGVTPLLDTPPTQHRHSSRYASIMKVKHGHPLQMIIYCLSASLK